MITKKLVLAFHEGLIIRFGGTDGVRDEGLLESALARPENLKFYNQEAGLFAQAASLTYGLIKNHPFIDGNKRTAAMACNYFLEKENYILIATELEEYQTYIKLSTDEISEAEFAKLLEINSRKKVLE